LKVLGKKEIQSLIIWRNKIKQKLQKKKKLLKEGEEGVNVDAEVDLDGPAEDENNYEERKLEELEGEIRTMSKQRKKKLEVERKKREQASMKNKLSFISQNEALENQDGVDFDTGIFGYLQDNEVDIEDLPENEQVDEESEEEEEVVDEFDLSDLTDDDYIDKLNQDVEHNLDEWNELHPDKTKRVNPSNMKKKKKKEEKIEYDSAGEQADDDDNDDAEPMDINEDGNEDELSFEDADVGANDDNEFENPLKKINRRGEKISQTKDQRSTKKKLKAEMDEGNIKINNI
jgi:AdoMet-dependent rRNA methyltransferase SPB1